MHPFMLHLLLILMRCYFCFWIWGCHSHGGTSIAGWFQTQNSAKKWMVPGYPHDFGNHRIFHARHLVVTASDSSSHKTHAVYPGNFGFSTPSSPALSAHVPECTCLTIIGGGGSGGKFTKTKPKLLTSLPGSKAPG